MIELSLDGNWTLRDSRQELDALQATVPGCVHTDLLAAGKIPDPWYRDNETKIHWVFQKDWIYERSFTVDADFLDRSCAKLVFEGLDTLCTVELNGQVVLEADNMHRIWEVEVKQHLREGANDLKLLFKSPLSLMKQRDAEKRLWGWNIFHENFWGKSYVRKMACAFGWDWGLMAPTAGIWRPARLIGYDARISDVRISQSHTAGAVNLTIEGHIDGEAEQASVVLNGPGGTHSVASTSLDKNRFHISISVDNPELWWPNGMGDQPLYVLVTELKNPDGCILDSNTRRIGLRSCELIREPDEHGETFRFRVNGRDVFMKGGNWIPCDVFPSRISDETYRDLLESCASSHMNMIRVWGGGIYEDDRFYNLCDELGLLVWQDFMFACSTYPSFDKAFMKSVRAEAVDNVRRIRHHPSLALWCGNNELEQGLVQWHIEDWTDTAMPPKDYLALFDELLPEVVNVEDPVTPYWPSSGHTPGENRPDSHDNTKGDAHSWKVWFGGQPIEAQRSWKFRFMSEFGFQSYPELKTVESFTAPEDRNMVNWVMDYHQRSGPGNQTILKYALEWFKEAKGFEESLVVSQLIQALCVQVAAEHARRIQGRMDGLLYWQINDLWPGATWSSIDVYGRWKALQHFAKRFFTPVLVSLLEDTDSGTVEAHVSNQRPESFKGVLKWYISDAAGNPIDSGEVEASVPSQANKAITTLACQKHREAGGTDRLPLEIRNHKSIPMTGDRDLFVWAVLEEDGKEISRNLSWFAKPKYWKLERPDIKASVTDRDGRTFIHLETSHAAPWTRLSLNGADALFSDNYLHLAPGLPVEVELLSHSLESNEEVGKRLKVLPFVDLFPCS